jgi:hypothetical protein
LQDFPLELKSEGKARSPPQSGAHERCTQVGSDPIRK